MSLGARPCERRLPSPFPGRPPFEPQVLTLQRARMPQATPLSRLLRRLEVPECRCPVKWQPLCLLSPAVGCRDRQAFGFCDCPLRKPKNRSKRAPQCLLPGCPERQERGSCECPRAPDAPCRHIRAIDPDDFPYELDEWGALLRFQLPNEYADPPAPAPLGDVVSRQARVAVMELRHPRQHLYHPADEWRREDWIVGRLGQMLRQRVNGRPAAGELAIECDQEAE